MLFKSPRNPLGYGFLRAGGPGEEVPWRIPFRRRKATQTLSTASSSGRRPSLESKGAACAGSACASSSVSTRGFAWPVLTTTPRVRRPVYVSTRTTRTRRSSPVPSQRQHAKTQAADTRLDGQSEPPPNGKTGADGRETPTPSAPVVQIFHHPIQGGFVILGYRWKTREM